MRLFKLITLLLGIALLVVVLRSIDLAAVWAQIRGLGWGGLAILLAFSTLWYLSDVAAWMLTFPRVRAGRRWFAQLFRVHVYGEALNVVTPGLPFGGEPVKAILLNTRYGVPLREVTATLLIAQTIIVCAELVFLGVGLVLMSGIPALPEAYRTAAGIALCVLVLCVALFVLVQRYRFVSRLGRRFGRRIFRLVREIHKVEGHLIRFYLSHPWRCAGAALLQFGNWTLGAIEIFLVLHFLGHPIGFHEAWAIEACVVLVRTALFIVPSSIGAQEGVFLVVCGAITGSPSLGLAMALIRRAREILWIVIGLAMGSTLTVSAGGGTPRDTAPP